jgi:hypothetical protein
MRNERVFIAVMSCSMLVDNPLMREAADEIATARVKIRSETFPCTELRKTAYSQGKVLLFRAAQR